MVPQLLQDQFRHLARLFQRQLFDKMPNDLEITLRMFPKHKGLLSFIGNIKNYENIRKKLGSGCEIPLLLASEKAFSAFVNDDTGWWRLCKNEQLFPFGYAGDGDLLVLQKDSENLGIVLIDSAQGPKAEWLFETSISFVRFIEMLEYQDLDSLEWIYQ